MQGKRILGWLLMAPLALNVLGELFLLVLIAFQGDANDERWILFTFIAILLVVTGPLAYVGWRLLRSSSGGEQEGIRSDPGANAPEKSVASGWMLVAISVTVMVATLLEVVLGLTGIVMLGRVLAAVGIWILFAVPLVEGIKRIRADRSSG